MGLSQYDAAPLMACTAMNATYDETETARDILTKAGAFFVLLTK